MVIIIIFKYTRKLIIMLKLTFEHNEKLADPTMRHAYLRKIY